jgi:hypothetical protein
MNKLRLSHSGVPLSKLCPKIKQEHDANMGIVLNMDMSDPLINIRFILVMVREDV